MNELESTKPKNISSNNSKFLTVCIIGKPNAGKSTLLNKLIGQKISIVTPKVQTTRTIITGIVTHENVQIVLLDTPGIFQPEKRLEKAMVRCAWSSINGTDIVALIIDSTKKIDDMTKTIISRLQESRVNLVFLLNKCDLLKTSSNNITENILYLDKHYPHIKQIQISALSGKGVDVFEDYMISNAKQEEWHYLEEDITTLPMRFLASEITREQLFIRLKEELPYNLTVDTETWEQQADGSVKINQVIIVSRPGHKPIILGNNGSMIKKIGMEARKNISEMAGQKVHLFLFVKVRQKWDENPENYSNMRLKYQN